jgi:hypothetical protein
MSTRDLPVGKSGQCIRLVSQLSVVAVEKMPRISTSQNLMGFHSLLQE